MNLWAVNKKQGVVNRTYKGCNQYCGEVQTGTTTKTAFKLNGNKGVATKICRKLLGPTYLPIGLFIMKASSHFLHFISY